MAIKRIYFVAHGGTVQGVGYRFFTRRHANKLALTGWVRNLPSNKVEGEVQGDAEDIKKLMALLDRGPSAAKVVRLDQEDRPVVDDDGDDEFEVRR